MQVVVQDSLTGAEQRHLMAWRERVFPEEGVGKQWSESEQHLLAREGDALPLAHIGFSRQEVHLGGRVLAVTGVGGVVVRPEAQGRHIPAQLFQVLHEQLGFHRFALFCPERLVTYYERHGYGAYAGSVHFKQRCVLVESRFAFMTRGFSLEQSGVVIRTLPW